MAYRLKDRNKQIPNGLTFLQPETNWRPPRYASFAIIVNAIISHRRRRPDLVQSKKWSLDQAVVAEELDAFNARLCAQHGWMDYITDGAGVVMPPKPTALLQQEKSVLAAAADKAKKIWSGLETLGDWIDSNTPPVAKEVSESRASICAKCPRNGSGDWTTWFTKPASEIIRKNQEKLAFMKLSTTHDATINICEICLCPLKLKVHTPAQYIKAHMSQSVLAELRAVPNCWIPKEVV